MGYVTTHFSQLIPPAKIQKTAGTWTPTIASNVVKDVRGAAAAAFTAFIPIDLESGLSYRAGAKVESIDVWYKIATADTTDFATVELEKVTLAADGVAVSAATVAVTVDADHNTAAERKAQGDHKMTVTPDADLYLEDGIAYYLTLIVDCAATSVVTLFGAQVNYELRA